MKCDSKETAGRGCRGGRGRGAVGGGGAPVWTPGGKIPRDGGARPVDPVRSKKRSNGKASTWIRNAVLIGFGSTFPK